MTYQIRDWDKHFENDRSRQREKCSFVCVPNKQHGMGFCRIMSEPDGAAIYGVWHMIVGACSQQTKRNGWLTSDGDSAGSPWGVDDLALKFRRPEKEVARALEVLTSEKVGWIVTAESPPSHRQPTVGTPLGTLKEGKEGKGKNSDKASKPRMKFTAEQIQVTKDFEAQLNSQWVNDAGKWVNRIKSHLGKCKRIIAEISLAVRESRISTTPAQYAEQLWKEFHD